MPIHEYQYKEYKPSSLPKMSIQEYQYKEYQFKPFDLSTYEDPLTKKPIEYKRPGSYKLSEENFNPFRKSNLFGDPEPDDDVDYLKKYKLRNFLPVIQPRWGDGIITRTKRSPPPKFSSLNTSLSPLPISKQKRSVKYQNTLF